LEKYHNLRGFLDFLESNIDKAFGDVGEWLGVWTIGGEGIDFHLSDLVQFEATTLIFADCAKLRVTYTPTILKDGDLVTRNRDFRDPRTVLRGLSGAYTQSHFERVSVQRLRYEH
jgi:hypothetical protein